MTEWKSCDCFETLCPPLLFLSSIALPRWQEVKQFNWLCSSRVNSTNDGRNILWTWTQVDHWEGSVRRRGNSAKTKNCVKFAALADSLPRGQIGETQNWTKTFAIETMRCTDKWKDDILEWGTALIFRMDRTEGGDLWVFQWNDTAHASPFPVQNYRSLQSVSQPNNGIDFFADLLTRIRVLCWSSTTSYSVPVLYFRSPFHWVWIEQILSCRVWN